MTLVGVSALGFLLGVRHATDVDHVVAITTIVCRQRTSRSAMLVGALWGVGHTVTILLVGGAIVLFGLVIPPPLATAMEMSVAAMLIVLGLLNLAGATPRMHLPAHAHAVDPSARTQGMVAPLLASPDAPVPLRAPSWPATLRPLAIGVVHGLAGSAALALLVLTTIRDAGRALIYLGVFGGGTVVGMMLLTTAMTLPIRLAARRFASLERIMAAVTGAISLAFGLYLVYRYGIADAVVSGAPASASAPASILGVALRRS